MTVRRNAHGSQERPQDTDVEQRRMKAGLRPLSRALIGANLNDRLYSGAEELLEAIKAEDNRAYATAISRYISYADAKTYFLQKHSKKRSLKDLMGPPPWLPLAREELTGFISEDPDSRSVLERTVFFQDDFTLLRALGNRVARQLNPGGAFTPKEYAAAVAIGVLSYQDPREN